MEKKINKIKVVTEATKFTSTIGVGLMIGNACSAFIPPQAKIPVKVCCYVGSIGISGAVNNKANEYWDEIGNAIEETIEVAKETIKKQKEDIKEKVTEEKPKKKETKKKSKKSSKKNEPIEVEFEEIEEEILEA